MWEVSQLSPLEIPLRTSVTEKTGSFPNLGAFQPGKNG